MGNTAGSYELGRGTVHRGHYLMLSGLPQSSSLLSESLCPNVAELDILVEGLFVFVFRL